MKKYEDYLIKEIIKNKYALSLSGINLGYIQGRWGILSKYPFNGIGDSLIFRITENTFYKTFPGNNHLIEIMNYKDVMLVDGWFWYHLKNMRVNESIDTKGWMALSSRLKLSEIASDWPPFIPYQWVIFSKYDKDWPDPDKILSETTKNIINRKKNMRKQILEGIAGIGLLVVLSACGAQKQTTASENTYAMVRNLSSGPEKPDEVNVQSGQLTRNVLIRQLQVDAQSVYSRMINYITPDEELAPVVSEQTLTAFIDFPANGIRVNPAYGNNRAELLKLEERFKSLLLSGNIKGIRVTGYASPDGNTKENERLAGNRAIQFKNYLQKQFNLSDPSLITIDWVGEDWKGLQRLVSDSQKPYRSRVEAVFQSTNDPDNRRKQIKAMDKGAVYKDIEKSFFSRLRRMELVVEMQVPVKTIDNVSLVEQIYSQPEKLSLQEIFRVASLYRPGTEQYREIYEIAAYTYPSSMVAKLNVAAASLALGDKEAARYFFQQVNDDQRAYNNLGVLSLMDGDIEAAAAYFRKYMPQNPRLARENLKIIEE